MSDIIWYLRNVKLSNILGFLGHKELKFIDGLHVIEANNHTGKTSFAIALLWGITGNLPSIDRISKSQFKLKNKLAADKAQAEIEIILENSNKEKFQICRSTNSNFKKFELTIKYNENIYTNDKAQEIISSQLGLKPQSLEGCCIVLQDQRLRLITGDLTISSEVIHDILGLSMLSKLVPIIKEGLRDLNKLVKDFEEKDPQKKWEERHNALKNELNKKESEAIEKGNNRQKFKTNFLEKEFNDLRECLEIQNSFEGRSSKELVDEIRIELRYKRDQNPYKSKRDLLGSNISSMNDTQKKIQEIKEKIKETEKEYLGLVNQYKVRLQEIILIQQEYTAKISSKQTELDLLKEQNGLFSHSLSLLKKQVCSSSCPLCQQPINREEFLLEIEKKLGDSIKKSINEYESDIKKLTDEKSDIEQLNLSFTRLEGNLRRDLGDSVKSLNALGEKYNEINSWIQQEMSGPLLDKTGEFLIRLDHLDNKIKIQINKFKEDYDCIKNECNDFEQKLSLLEEKLDNIAMYLIPINDIHIKLLEHAIFKDESINQNTKYSLLLDSTNGYIRQLEELKIFLQNKEKKKANQIITEHQNFVTNFFVKVADNPNYDSITITAEENHGSIKYDFQASSTKTPNLTDAAKHVLSGGDLSVACLGLMMSLTKGKSNKTGFMVLDDPGESFDMVRMDNFANEIQNVPSHQTIILTHQADFAGKLRQKGAESIYL